MVPCGGPRPRAETADAAALPAGVRPRFYRQISALGSENNVRASELIRISATHRGLQSEVHIAKPTHHCLEPLFLRKRAYTGSDSRRRTIGNHLLIRRELV